jgi:hypothetical protein
VPGTAKVIFPPASLLLVGALLAALGGTSRGASPALTPPAADVSSRAMALIKENCLACHNPEKKKGKLVLTSREAALAGGENGPALVPGNASQSHLAAAILAEADPHMPPKGQLSAGEIATLRAWIDAGATWDQAALTKVKLASTQPI